MQNSPVRAIVYVTKMSNLSYQQTSLKQQMSSHYIEKPAHSLSKVV